MTLIVNINTLVNAFIVFRIDYGNGLLAGIGKADMHRLQRVLNESARLITWRGRRDYIAAVLRDELHWLHILQRIKYKLCLTIYKSLYFSSPSYIRELVLRVSNNEYTRRLRSADTMNLVTPRTRKGFGDRDSQWRVHRRKMSCQQNSG